MKTLVFDNIFNISGCAFTFCPLILRRGTGRWKRGRECMGSGRREEGVSKVTGIGTNLIEGKITKHCVIFSNMWKPTKKGT